MKDIIIQSFFGIGDLLFATPSFRVIKESYPNCNIIVNTNRPSLLQNNPYIDEIGTEYKGTLLMYTAPDTGRLPIKHHILEDWEIICKEYNLETERPKLKPELYIKNLSQQKEKIGVQVLFKRNYYNKRVWPYFHKLVRLENFEAVPEFTSGDKMLKLVEKISEYKNIVCAEGGISHIRAALGLPAIVLFGGFNDPLWTGYDFHTNVVSNVECKHCYNLNPCKNKFRCWDDITIDYVRSLL